MNGTDTHGISNQWKRHNYSIYNCKQLDNHLPKNKFKMNLKNEIYHIIDPNVHEKIIYNKDGISNSVGNG